MDLFKDIFASILGDTASPDMSDPIPTGPGQSTGGGGFESALNKLTGADSSKTPPTGATPAPTDGAPAPPGGGGGEEDFLMQVMKMFLGG